MKGGVGGELRGYWAAGKTDERVPDPVKPETSLEAEMTQLKLSYFGHSARRQSSLGKTVMLGKIEASRKRGRPSMRKTNSMKDAVVVSPRELSRAAEDRTPRTCLVHGVTRRVADPAAGNPGGTLR